MITEWYEVTCDYCGKALNHYIGKRPTQNDLEADGFYCTATKVFCNSTCWGDWKHDVDEKKYLNIHPNGKIHND